MKSEEKDSYAMNLDYMIVTVYLYYLNKIKKQELPDISWDETSLPAMAWLDILCVHPKMRKLGIARKLIDIFSEYVKDNIEEKDNGIILGLEIIETKAGHIDKGLMTFYQKLGFEFEMNSKKYMWRGNGRYGGKIIHT